MPTVGLPPLSRDVDDYCQGHTSSARLTRYQGTELLLSLSRGLGYIVSETHKAQSLVKPLSISYYWIACLFFQCIQVFSIFGSTQLFHFELSVR